MIVKQEIREERTDVYSFWENIPTIENGKIVQVETKVEETTIAELDKRIADFENQVIDIQNKIVIEKSKIELINSL